MAIYEYYCYKCKSNFEEMKNIKDRDSVKCPECGIKAKLKLSNYSFKMNIKG